MKPIAGQRRRGAIRRVFALAHHRRDAINRVSTLCRIAILLLFIGCAAACIDSYTPERFRTEGGILVVDGIITHDTTRIRLTRTAPMDANLTTENAAHPAADATVCVERSDGIRYTDTRYVGNGVYTISNARLDTALRYRLRIDLEGESYESEYLPPLVTPDIDSISWVKRGTGQPVYICVSTHDTHDRSRCYRWTYREHWELRADFFAQAGFIGLPTVPPNPKDIVLYDLHTANNTYYCWNTDSSKTFLMEDVDRLTENAVVEKRLIQIAPWHDKLSILYYVTVTQHQIRKEAYDYYANLQHNIEQTGSLFSAIPSEMAGNVRCISDPQRPAIGFVEVSTAVTSERFIPTSDNLYEPVDGRCAATILQSPFDPSYELPVVYLPVYGKRHIAHRRRIGRNQIVYFAALRGLHAARHEKQAGFLADAASVNPPACSTAVRRYDRAVRQPCDAC